MNIFIFYGIGNDMNQNISAMQQQSNVIKNLDIFKPILEISFEAKFILSVTYKILISNKNAQVLFGFSSDDQELTISQLLGIETAKVVKIFSALDGYKIASSELQIRYQGLALNVQIMCSKLKCEEEDVLLLTIKDLSKSLLTEKIINESEAKRIFALDAAQIGDWDMDLTTNVAYRSYMHDLCFGYKSPIKTWGYDTFLSHVHPEDRKRVDENYKTALIGNGNYDVEFKVIWPDKSIHWLWSRGQFYFDDSGKPIRVSGIQVDITSKKVAEESLQISSRALDAATNGIWIADVRFSDMPLIYVNPAFEKMTGYLATEVLGKNCHFLTQDDCDENKLSEIRDAMNVGIEIEQEIKSFRKDGAEFLVDLKLSPVKDDMGLTTHYVGIHQDVTEKKARILSIKHQAEHDSLTGLYNRHYFTEYVDELIKNSTLHNECFALIYLDLDHFKRINDALGHAMGDKVLCHVANAISKVNLNNCIQIRLGGDEFVIICPYADRTEISNALNEIHKQINKIIKHKHLSISPTVSIGVAFFPEDGKSAQALLKNADLAMYTAKLNGRNCIEFFSPSMDALAKSELTLEIELNKALKNGDIYLEYQPQIDIKSGRLIGIEALARWEHKKLGQISPVDFIRIAENSGLINNLGHYIMSLACRQNSLWLKAGVHNVSIAVNVSAHQFKHVEFITNVKRVLDESGLPPYNLELELTESIVMRNTADVLVKLEDLRSIGIKLSIDDFGTGYSSLSYLRNFPIDRLKIDRSFINNATENKSSAAITKSIVMLGHNLGLDVIAEGVETKEQVVMLRKMKCDQAQGYFFSKPLTPAKFETFCNALK